jgi:Flp pilus assembly protein TadG
MAKNLYFTKKFSLCHSGASAVEFALVAPLLLVILFGMVAFGWYLAVVHGVEQLAAEAARSSVAGLTDTERSSLARTYVTSNIGAYPFMSPTNLTVNAAASSSNANVFVVTVSYDASKTVIYSLSGLLPVPSPNIARSAAIPRGGF